MADDVRKRSQPSGTDLQRPQKGDRVPPGSGQVVYTEGRDPREDEGWFQDLPAQEREHMRARWAAERTRLHHRPATRWRWLGMAAWQGALLFLVLGLLQAPLVGLGALLPLTLAGSAAGLLGQILGGGRFAFAFAGILAFSVVMLPRLSLSLFSPLGMIGLMAASFGMGVLGIDREMRRTGGFGSA